MATHKSANAKNIYLYRVFVRDASVFINMLSCDIFRTSYNYTNKCINV